MNNDIAGDAERRETVYRLNQASRDGGNEVVDAADGVLSIIVNREHVPLARLAALLAEDLEVLYDRFIGPAVDALEEHLLHDHRDTPLQDDPSISWEPVTAQTASRHLPPPRPEPGPGFAI